MFYSRNSDVSGFHIHVLTCFSMLLFFESSWKSWTPLSLGGFVFGWMIHFNWNNKRRKKEVLKNDMLKLGAHFLLLYFECCSTVFFMVWEKVNGNKNNYGNARFQGGGKLLWGKRIWILMFRKILFLLYFAGYFDPKEKKNLSITFLAGVCILLFFTEKSVLEDFVVLS